MDKTQQLAKIVVEYLEQYSTEMYQDDPSEVKTELIHDTVNHHYQLLRYGWDNGRFVYFFPLHFQVSNEKIWVLRNNTEELVGDELIKLGSKHSEIVFAFHNPKVRHLTEFAVG